MALTAPKVWRFIAFACVIFFFVRVGQLIYDVKNAPPRKPAPGEESFMAANKLITGRSGNNGHGNNVEAAAIALDYSKLMKSITQQAFTGGKPGTLGDLTTHGEVPVYCLLTKDHCTIITQIPELRQYSYDALSALHKLSWITFQGVAGQHNIGKDVELTLGLRGLMLYEPIMKGRLGAEPTTEDGDDKLRYLQTLFAAAESAATSGTGTATGTASTTAPAGAPNGAASTK